MTHFGTIALIDKQRRVHETEHTGTLAEIFDAALMLCVEKDIDTLVIRVMEDETDE